jgi:preprotein translocase subunit SecD
MSESDRGDITDSLNLTGTVYLRPVLICAPPTPTTTPDTVVDTTIATGSVGDGPSPQEILPTRDGGRCQVGPAAGTGDVFVANSAVASTMNNGGWGVTVDLKSGPSGEGVWNTLASECFNKAPTCPSQQLAIELNGQIQTAPTIKVRSYTGPIQITGSFSERQARALAATLNFGGLPFTLRVVSAVFTP